MRSHLVFLPAQCDRPILTILDGLDDHVWRSVLNIARRCGHDVYHVGGELRKMVVNGQADVLNVRHGLDMFECRYRASTAWRLDDADQVRRDDRQSRKGPRRRVDAAQGDGRVIRAALMMTPEDFPEPLDGKVGQFLAEGVEHG